jgi:simple sugar transport system permease protein
MADSALIIYTAATLRLATPLVLAGLGAILSERAGVINIALEGMMLVGAFCGMWAASTHGSLAGIAAAIGGGALLGLMHLFFTQRLRMNHVVSGAALNILALNVTTFLFRRVFKMASPPRSPVVDNVLPVWWFVALAIVLPLIAHYVLYHTPLGLRLRAVGESPESVRLAGIKPGPLRAVGVIGSGVFAGLAGAYLSMSLVGRFSDDMVSGRGFIALAAVICGRWTPLGLLTCALAFGVFDAMQLQLQGTVSIPSDFIQMAPYIATILAALLVKPKPPAALGVVGEGS